MNGPNPVCTSARKKMNQSRPRRLWRDGDGGLRAGSDGGGSWPPPLAWWRRSSSILGCLDERANSLPLSKSSAGELQRLQAARGAEHHDRRVFLVFGRRSHLLLGQ